MKKDINFFKIINASLALLMLIPYTVNAMETEQIRSEINKVLEKFHHNMKEYYQRVEAKKKPIKMITHSSITKTGREKETATHLLSSIEEPQKIIYTDDTSYISENPAQMEDGFYIPKTGLVLLEENPAPDLLENIQEGELGLFIKEDLTGDSLIYYKNFGKDPVEITCDEGTTRVTQKGLSTNIFEIIKQSITNGNKNISDLGWFALLEFISLKESIHTHYALYQRIKNAYNTPKATRKPAVFLDKFVGCDFSNDPRIIGIIQEGTEWVMAPLANTKIRKYDYYLHEDKENKNNIVKCIRHLTEKHKQYDLVEESNTAQRILDDHRSPLTDNVTFKHVFKMQTKKDDLRSIANDFYLVVMREPNNTIGEVENLIQKLNGIDPQEVARRKREEEERKAPKKMGWPKWIPFDQQRSSELNSTDPAIRGHIIFNDIKNASSYNASPIEFTRCLISRHCYSIGCKKRQPVYCVMKEANATGWEMIELVGVSVKPESYSVSGQEKAINYITKEHLSYELVPDSELTQINQSFFVFQMKTAEDNIQDDFYLVEGDTRKIQGFLKTLNQSIEQK